ncbi:hypothetical protein SJI00_13805 [Pseudomonas sp. RP23018S]|uniref:hypothetical protein n=1 Tax=Pseudomonas sp. RP23018S TaxID=3096037 RepID=UPI002ACAD84E|nr:hypothetical protein [Pseudomonas sp. RP23018S]MDZ5603853.1 hypothetical protein [Pseudomonas sp. RP23018S]
MRALLPMAAALLMVGCASSTMDAARTGPPSAQLDSRKPAERVAECIQYSWQDEAVFGVDASGYKDARKGGGFTVYTREAQAFVDIYPKGAGTHVDFYAQQQDSTALRRKAGAATCL